MTLKTSARPVSVAGVPLICSIGIVLVLERIGIRYRRIFIVVMKHYKKSVRVV